MIQIFNSLIILLSNNSIDINLNMKSLQITKMQLQSYKNGIRILVVLITLDIFVSAIGIQVYTANPFLQIHIAGPLSESLSC